MKQIAVTIPDNKESLFIELMKNLSFVKGIENIENINIPEWHKAIIDQRMENFKVHPESFRDWEEVQREINLKYGI
ncbi:MAG: addiction module protein [Mariniphaga sp.]|nr:addiction module protein [Mariniphaga sp.]